MTRAPFDETGISVRHLRSDPVGVVLRIDDPLAGRGALRLRDLTGRRWFRLPEGTDPLWRDYWCPAGPYGERRDHPVVRTAQECLQAVLWNDTVGVSPLPHALPEGLTTVPLTDMPPSRLVVAWHTSTTDPLVRSFTRLAAASYAAAAEAERADHR